MKTNLETYFKKKFLNEATEKQEANQKLAEDIERLRELKEKVQKAKDFYQNLLDTNADSDKTKEASLQLKQVKGEFDKLKASVELQKMHRSGESVDESGALIYDPETREQPEEKPKQSIKAEDYGPKDKLDYIAELGFELRQIFEDGEPMDDWIVKIINKTFEEFNQIEKYIKNNQEPNEEE